MVVLLFLPYISHHVIKHVIKNKQYIIFFKTLGNCFNAAGDYNAKHIKWRSWLILSKDREFLKAAFKAMNLATISTEESTPGHLTAKRCTEFRHHQDYYRTESCLELFSDHSSIIITVNNKLMIKDPPKYLLKVSIE